MVRSFALLLGVLLLGVRADGASPISLSASPKLTVPGNSVRITVRVERHADNRRLILLFEGPDRAGSADRPLHGDAAATQFVFEKELRNLGQGIYAIQARVLRLTNGKVEEFSTPIVNVYSGVGPLEDIID